VEFTFTDANELVIEYLATTNKKTIINLTHHGFFSLAGIANPTPTIDNLVCEINADYYLPIDNTSIPTGEIRFVKDRPFDFRTPKEVGRDIDADDEQIKNGAGYDHCFVLNKKEEGELSYAAKITEPDAQWKYTPQNPECRFIRTIGLTDMPDNMEPLSRAALPSALNVNISRTVPIILTSRQ